MKKIIKVGNVLIGSNEIIIQSMTNTKTKDIDKTVEQINKLHSLGAKLVRVTISCEEDALAIKEIKKQINVPLIGDIHFDYKLALLAINNGIDKIRINPGNIKEKDHIKQIVDLCKEKNIPIRIGINSGSLQKDIYEKYGKVTPEGLIESMERYVKLIESFDFYNLVLSIKATDINTNIIANRLLNERFNYPIHVGLTESGTISSGTIRSSYVLGTLLNENIGNTIRVSLTGDPSKEIPVAKEILSMFGLYKKPTLISCPTCGRTNYDLESITNEMEEFLSTINSSIKVAIMGCVVNGPGEAKDADIGIAGGNHEVLLFKKGEIIKKIPEDKIIEVLKKEILEMTKVV